MAEPRPRRLGKLLDKLATRATGQRVLEVDSGGLHYEVWTYRRGDTSMVIGTAPHAPSPEVRIPLFTATAFTVDRDVNSVDVFPTPFEQMLEDPLRIVHRNRVIVAGTTESAKVSGDNELRVHSIQERGNAEDGGMLLVDTYATDILVSGYATAEVGGNLLRHGAVTDSSLTVGGDAYGQVTLDMGEFSAGGDVTCLTVKKGNATADGLVMHGHVNDLEGHITAEEVRNKSGVVDNITETGKAA